MEKIELKFQHGRLVFSVGDKEFFITSDDFLNLLDQQRTHEIFHSVDPAVIYADWERFDFVVEMEVLKERGLNLDEIASHVGTTRARLEGWMSERTGVIERIKNENPSNFAAAVRGRKERPMIKRGYHAEEKKD